MKPYFFDFNFGKLKKLYDNGCNLNNYLANGVLNEFYIYYKENQFEKSDFLYSETELKWSAHKDGKQLTREEIEEIINDMHILQKQNKDKQRKIR